MCLHSTPHNWIPLHPDSKEKTAFVTPWGTFQYETLPFGLTGGPATFSRIMNRIMEPHLGRCAFV